MSELGKTGFAAMTPERRREIATMGGRAVPRHKRSFFRKRQLAREAGRKGGQKCEIGSFSRDPEAARIAGRKGGLATSAQKRSFARDVELARRAGCLGRAAQRAKKAQPPQLEPTGPDTED